MVKKYSNKKKKKTDENYRKNRNYIDCYKASDSGIDIENLESFNLK